MLHATFGLFLIFNQKPKLTKSYEKDIICL